MSIIDPTQTRYGPGQPSTPGWNAPPATTTTGPVAGRGGGPYVDDKGVFHPGTGGRTPVSHRNPASQPDNGTFEADNATRDAYARYMDVLHHYGLDDLADWAWRETVNGTSNDAFLLDLQNQDAFKTRFWVIDARRQAGLSPVSAQDVLNYEDQWNQMAHAAGLPDTMGSRDTAQKLMAANVSAAEAQDRVQRGYVEMHNTSAEVRAAFSNYFGIQGDGALAALFIDPNLALPDLERMVSEAQIGGAGARAGFSVSSQIADRLARMGISEAGAQQGFGQLVKEHPLFEQTISETQPLSAETGIAATFGLNPDAAAQVKRVADQRLANFTGATTAATDQSGIVGAGQARSV